MDVNILNSSKHVKKLQVPAYVKIGVTGHRRLSNGQLFREFIQNVLGKLDKILSHTPYTLVAVSAVAEGADRLVAKEVLEWQASDDKHGLEVVLPLHEDDYLQDFGTQDSKDEFREFLAKAKYIPLVIG